MAAWPEQRQRALPRHPRSNLDVLVVEIFLKRRHLRPLHPIQAKHGHRPDARADQEGQILVDAEPSLF